MTIMHMSEASKELLIEQADRFGQPVFGHPNVLSYQGLYFWRDEECLIMDEIYDTADEASAAVEDYVVNYLFA